MIKDEKAKPGSESCGSFVSLKPFTLFRSSALPWPWSRDAALRKWCNVLQALHPAIMPPRMGVAVAP